MHNHSAFNQENSSAFSHISMHTWIFLDLCTTHTPCDAIGFCKHLEVFSIISASSTLSNSQPLKYPACMSMHYASMHCQKLATVYTCTTTHCQNLHKFTDAYPSVLQTFQAHYVTSLHILLHKCRIFQYYSHMPHRTFTRSSGHFGLLFLNVSNTPYGFIHISEYLHCTRTHSQALLWYLSTYINPASCAHSCWSLASISFQISSTAVPHHQIPKSLLPSCPSLLLFSFTLCFFLISCFSHFLLTFFVFWFTSVYFCFYLSDYSFWFFLNICVLMYLQSFEWFHEHWKFFFWA